MKNVDAEKNQKKKMVGKSSSKCDQENWRRNLMVRKFRTENEIRKALRPFSRNEL